MVSSPKELGMWQTVIIVLVFTLFGSALTLWVLKKLLKPVDLAKKALLNYVSTKEIPELPINYEDEVGLLLAGLQTAIEKLDAAEKNQADLIALLSHDLRSPFVNIIGLAQVIKIEQNQVQIESMCDMMINSSKQQLQFIDEVSKLYKTENLLLKKSNENLYILIEHVLKQQASVINQKELRVVFNIDKAKLVSIDLLLIKQVITNLIVNAIKFSNQGGEIVFKDFEEVNQYKLEITDFGIGMTDELQQELFKEVVRNGRIGTFGEKSSGLGLYLCAKIMRKHKGLIQAFSPGVGKGSTFTLTFTK